MWYSTTSYWLYQSVRFYSAVYMYMHVYMHATNKIYNSELLSG